MLCRVSSPLYPSCVDRRHKSSNSRMSLSSSSHYTTPISASTLRAVGDSSPPVAWPLRSFVNNFLSPGSGLHDLLGARWTEMTVYREKVRCRPRQPRSNAEAQTFPRETLTNTSWRALNLHQNTTPRTLSGSAASVSLSEPPASASFHPSLPTRTTKSLFPLSCRKSVTLTAVPTSCKVGSMAPNYIISWTFFTSSIGSHLPTF